MNTDVLTHDMPHQLGEHATHLIEQQNVALASLLLLAGLLPRRRHASPARCFAAHLGASNCRF
jgi:hypothetical protein